MSEGAYDFIDEFNERQAGMTLVTDPHERLAALRRECPVQRIALRDILGENVPKGPGMPDVIYSVLSHETVAQVLLDGATFSSAGYAKSMGLVMGHTILEMDEPEHGRYRSLLQKAFSKRALDRWERELVRPVVHGLVDKFVSRGRAELVRELTLPFPVSVIAGMIGLDPADHLLFHRLAVELISIAIDPARGMRASQGLRELFARVLAERRSVPRDDQVARRAAAPSAGLPRSPGAGARGRGAPPRAGRGCGAARRSGCSTIDTSSRHRPARGGEGTRRSPRRRGAFRRARTARARSSDRRAARCGARRGRARRARAALARRASRAPGRLRC